MASVYLGTDRSSWPMREHLLCVLSFHLLPPPSFLPLTQSGPRQSVTLCRNCLLLQGTTSITPKVSASEVRVIFPGIAQWGGRGLCQGPCVGKDRPGNVLPSPHSLQSLGSLARPLPPPASYFSLDLLLPKFILKSIDFQAARGCNLVFHLEERMATGKSGGLIAVEGRGKKGFLGPAGASACRGPQGWASERAWGTLPPVHTGLAIWEAPLTPPNSPTATLLPPPCLCPTPLWRPASPRHFWEQRGMEPLFPSSQPLPSLPRCHRQIPPPPKGQSRR